jgi:hypothetical protein
MDTMRSRLSAALRARLAPNTGIHVKQLAGAIGRSGEAVRQWLAGEAAIKAEDLAAVAEFFGEPSFLMEVFGDLAVSATRETRLWFTDRGICHEASGGHGDLVRRHLSLPGHIAGDVAIYAMRNLGWVELTAAAASARLRYHAKGIKPGAAAAARSWLLERNQRIASVSRAAFVGIEWVEASGLAVAAVAGELALAAAAPRSRKVERRTLDGLPPRLGAVYRAWRGSQANVLDVAAGVGLGARVNIFTADDGGNVHCRWIGPEVRALPRECVGANVLGWSDPIYGAELRCSILEAREEAATFTELQIPMFGETVRFDRLALDVAGYIVTITERKELEAA